MNELSLFTGAGGGLLGSILLGWHPIGYVEWDDYCQRVIAARIRDGILPDAPIFGDIKAFIRDGYAHSYQGVVDVITAGFPCQPFSVAGKQKGADDARNMWPATAECIGIVRPRFCLLENVPGIRAYLPVVVRDLRRLGYEVSRPLILGADDVGAPHRRKRVWIYAHNAVNGGSQERWPGHDPKMARCGKDRQAARYLGAEVEEPNRHDSDAASVGCQDGRGVLSGLHRPEAGNGENKDLGDNSGYSWADPWPEVAARLCRVDDGVAHRVDRLKALGNGQVPQCMATAFRILTGQIQGLLRKVQMV